jgi:hypothetical protein
MPVTTNSGKEFSFLHDSAHKFEDFAKSLARLPFGEVDVEEAGLLVNRGSVN